MKRTQQLAALRRDLRTTFPSCHPMSRAVRGHHAPTTGLPTGFPPLDRLLNAEGFPRGRISELTGRSSSGKTSLAFQVIAHTTASGLPVAYIDAAGSFYPPSAARAGVVLDRLLLIRIHTIREGLKAADILLRGQAFPLVLFDWSTDPLEEPTQQDPGMAIARLNGLCSLGQAILLFLTTPKTARDAIRYYASIRLEVRRSPLPHPSSMVLSPSPGLGAARLPEGHPGAVPPQDPGNPRESFSPKSEETRTRPLRLVGLPHHQSGGGMAVHLIKNKLGAPGGHMEIPVYGSESPRLPLHPGLSGPDSPAR